ncbi:MAG TPA: glycoside hydrolase family 43 protein [Oscillospiraceae bacterium]|nr:glycoside hydrolase family 43 protein [Oscillospiraceae bacterium]
MLFKNPVIRGFNPDPSICRVGDDFYLVTSTFEFFPGIPVYHSKNLANWEMVSHCLDENENLPLEGSTPSGGLYAPTIRYNNGTFYVICTNVTNMTNFIVHTDNPCGKWSKPVRVDHMGIDPSLFFDDDGKCYFSGTAFKDGSWGIEIAQINPDTGEFLSEKHFVNGCGGKSPEAPHIYKRGGYYYLMLAEGGTEYGHMVTMQRSRNVFGPYEPCPFNPILSHKDKYSEIQATGHADIVEDQNGNWWAVFLGIRANGFLHHLGRETFLAPARWNEDGWFEIGNNKTIEAEMDAPLPAKPEDVSFDFEDDFCNGKLRPEWTFVRNPEKGNYVLSGGKLIMKGTSKDLGSFNTSPTFMGIRQPENNIEAYTKLKANFSCGSKAGMTAFYNQDYYYAIYLTKRGRKYEVCLNKAVHDINVVTNCAEVDCDGVIEFKIKADKEKYYFYYKMANSDWTLLGTALTAGLATEGTHMMTFTGTFIGLYAYECTAEFDYFKLKTNPQK